MKSIIYFWILFLLVFLSCAKENNFSKNGFTYADFDNNLTADMNYDSIVSIFGNPSKDIGSGIHIYVYQLTDSTEIWIGYIDRIVYARHVDKNHQILDTIIGETAHSLSYLYFKDKLKPEMSYNSIVETFGKPSKQIGSGIQIFVYQLADKT